MGAAQLGAKGSEEGGRPGSELKWSLHPCELRSFKCTTCNQVRCMCLSALHVPKGSLPASHRLVRWADRTPPRTHTAPTEASSRPEPRRPGSPRAHPMRPPRPAAPRFGRVTASNRGPWDLVVFKLEICMAESTLGRNSAREPTPIYDRARTEKPSSNILFPCEHLWAGDKPGYGVRVYEREQLGPH
jgi:hypothetical protein